MKVIVTGAFGFIGKAVCQKLKSEGHFVRGMDWSLTPAKLTSESLASVNEVFLADVRDPDAVMTVVDGMDGVIHLAGILGTQETIKTPEGSVQVNVVGSLNIFNACLEFGTKCVYIAVGNHWMNNSYSISKTTAERFALMYNKEMNTKIAIVRAMNAYGPGQKLWPVNKIVPSFINAALNDQPLVIYGNGHQIMDMIYVDDVAETLVAALLVDHNTYHQTFEVGTGRSTTVNHIAGEIIRQVGSGTTMHVDMRPGELPNSVVLADNSLIESRLGINPQKFTQLSEGIAISISYYSEMLKKSQILR